jgi:hypothetical protein
MLEESELRALIGHDVRDRHGKAVGYVDVIFNDDQTGRPEWIGVLTGSFRHRHVLVPITGAERDDGSLKLPWSKERVKGAPRYDREDHRGILGLGEYRLAVSAEKERAACDYYELDEAGLEAGSG